MEYHQRDLLRRCGQHHGFILNAASWSRRDTLALHWEMVTWEPPYLPGGWLHAEVAGVQRCCLQLGGPPAGAQRVPQELWLSQRDPVLPWGQQATLFLTRPLGDPWAFLGELTFALDGLVPGTNPLSLLPGAEDMRAWLEATQRPPHRLMEGPEALVRMGHRILEEGGGHGRLIARELESGLRSGIVLRWGDSWVVGRALTMSSPPPL